MSQTAAQSNRRAQGLEENSKSIGVLYTGYLEKKNPVTGSYNKRFVVLTHEALHWFVRLDGDDLFGEERGRIGLGAIISTRILEEDANAFQIESTDKTKRFFRSTSPVMCEEWVSAIKSTTKNLSEYQKKKVSFPFRHQNGEEEEATLEVTILLVSHASKDKEIVLSRNTGWNRVININNFKSVDKILISTSNGGMVTLTSDVLALRSEGAVDFEVAVQGVTLASSLRMTVQKSIEINSVSKPQISSDSFFSSIIAITMAISSNRAQFVPFFLAVMVLFVGISSILYLEAHFMLFFMFSMASALYVVYSLYQSTADALSSNKGDNYSLRIHAHAFTSPDAPIYALEDEIPKRFIDGCEGDMKEARRRWDITRHWRETEGLNTILQTPQPHFFTIKAYLPHYNFGQGKLGHIVYYERPGDIQADELTARGVTVDDLWRHWLFVTEYQFGILAGGDETAKTIAVLDIEKVNMSFLSGDPFVHLKRTLSAANAHYPERSYVIYVVNAPLVALMMWRVIKPMVHPNTQKKVRILSKKETLLGLQEHIDLSQIPEYYGGEAHCDPPEGEVVKDVKNDSCRFYGPETLAMNEYVRKLNQGSNVADPFDQASKKSTESQPPGKQGAYSSSQQSHMSGRAGSNDSTPETPISGPNSISAPTPPSMAAPLAPPVEVVRASTTNIVGGRKVARGTITGKAELDAFSVCSDPPI